MKSVPLPTRRAGAYLPQVRIPRRAPRRWWFFRAGPPGHLDFDLVRHGLPLLGCTLIWTGSHLWRHRTPQRPRVWGERDEHGRERVNAVDLAVRRALLWKDPIRARLFSNLLANFVVPAGTVSLAIAAGLKGGGGPFADVLVANEAMVYAGTISQGAKLFFRRQRPFARFAAPQPAVPGADAPPVTAGEAAGRVSAAVVSLPRRTARRSAPLERVRPTAAASKFETSGGSPDALRLDEPREPLSHPVGPHTRTEISEASQAKAAEVQASQTGGPRGLRAAILRMDESPISKERRAYQVDDDNLSFFSSHTSTTTAFAFAVAQIATRRRVRTPLVFLLGAAAGLTGYLRIASDRHYFSDVIVGGLVGATVGTLVPRLLHPVRREKTWRIADSVDLLRLTG